MARTEQNAAADLSRFDKPQVVDRVEAAFGGDMQKLLPPYNDLPQEFRREEHPACKVVTTWFYGGLQALPPIKDGIDRKHAMNHLRAVIGSWAPKHEHKIAGAGYLISRWFELEGYEPKPAKGAA